MNPTPMNKTEIISFVIDEILLKLWNTSSNMRKRVQMVLKDKDITIKEYREKALKLNNSVKLKYYISLKETSEMKKGVSNYTITSQEQLNKVISLNGKLRCEALDFKPENPVSLDSINTLNLAKDNYSEFLDWSFNTVDWLNLYDLSSKEIKEVVSKFNFINNLSICCFDLSKLDLSSAKITNIYLENASFTDTLVLPGNLKYLSIDLSGKSFSFKANKIESVYFKMHKGMDLNLLKQFKSVKKFAASGLFSFSETLKTLPSTLREMRFMDPQSFEKVDSAQIARKFPYLINVNNPIEIELAQALNLRNVFPEFEVKEYPKFALRPRKMCLTKLNNAELNKHPELFEKLEEIWFNCEKINFDLFPEKIKKIKTSTQIEIENQFLVDFKRNAWKFEETEFYLLIEEENDVRNVLDCLEKAKIVRIRKKFDFLKKDYPHLVFKKVD